MGGFFGVLRCDMSLQQGLVLQGDELSLLKSSDLKGCQKKKRFRSEGRCIYIVST